MSDIVLSNRATKLMTLCASHGLALDDLVAASVSRDACPAICVTEGRDHITKMKPNQDEGHCDACGGNTVVSVLVLAGFI